MGKKIHCLLLFIFVFCVSLFKIRNPDLGFHLVSGRFLLENFSFPSTDFSTFTRFGLPDFPHSVIPSALFYELYKIGGFALLCSFKAVLYGLTFSLIFLAATRSLPALSFFKTSILLLLGSIAAVICRDRLALQPFMFTDLCLAGLLWELPKVKKDPFRWRRILIFTGIFLVWFNAHLGVIHGIALFGIFILSLLAEKKYAETFQIFKIYGALIILTGVLSAFANPSSANIWPHLFFELRNSLKQTFVAEYQSGVHAYGPHLIFMGFSAALLLLLSFNSIRKEKAYLWFPFATFLFFMILTIRYQREITHLALAWYFLCGSLWIWVPVNRKHEILGFLLTLGVTAILLLEIHYPALAFGVGLHSRAVPQRGFEVVREKMQPERIYNTLSLGGWWSFFLQEQFSKLERNEQTPGKIFHDGRGPLFNKEFFQTKVLPILQAENKGQIILEDYGVNVAVLSYFDPLCTSFARSERWELSYFDEALTVFSRKPSKQPRRFSMIDPCDSDRKIWSHWDAWSNKERAEFAEQLRFLSDAFPKNPRILYLQGILEAKQNHFSESTKRFFESGEAGDIFNNAYGNAGKIACAEGQFPLANLLFEKAKDLMVAETPFWDEWTACLRLQKRDMRAAVEWAKGRVYSAYFAFRS